MGHDTEIPNAARAERHPRSLDLYHAAALLGVSPETVVAWEERYGFPSSGRSVRRYSQSEVLALRDSLEDGLSIALCHGARPSEDQAAPLPDRRPAPRPSRRRIAS